MRRGLTADFRGAPSLVGALDRGTMIKSIQRGTITLNNVTSNTATITAVDPNNSVLTLLGWTDTSVSTDQENWAARIVLTNATTVTATVNTGSAFDLVVAFEVVEYWPGVIRSIQRGTITTSGASSGTATITAVDTSKASVRNLGYTTTGTGGQAANLGGRLTLTNATTVTLTLGNSLSNVQGFEVLEFY